MSDQESHGQDQASATTNRSCGSRWGCPLQKRFGLWLWLAFIGAVLYLQWPMVKGLYYRVADPAPPASAIAWRTDFEAALAEAAATGKPVLVDFTASWCPPCKVMKHEVWPDGNVAAAVDDGYIPLLVDVDEPRNAAVAQRYGIVGIPTILVLDAEGVVLRTGSFMTARTMVEFLNAST